LSGGSDRLSSGKTVDIGGHGSVTVVKGPPFTTPKIMRQPVNTSKPAGETATFTSTATGNPTPTVQWQVDTNTGWVNLDNGTQGDGSTISGATTDTLTISNVQADENFAYYWAVFTNSQGQAISNETYLYVTGAAIARTAKGDGV
jgi:hypothetical protein